MMRAARPWLAAALVLGACASSPEPRSDARPGGDAREVEAPRKRLQELGAPLPEVKPPRAESRVGATLTLPLESVRTLIDREVPRTLEQDWQRLTRKGRSPEVEARYVVTRQPLSLSMQGEQLRVELPVTYHADLRGRVRVPIVGTWLKLSGDRTWGTAQQPQRMTLSALLDVSIEDDYGLRVKATALPPKHGKPPGGKACVKAGLNLCVSKQSLAPEVRQRIDAAVVPRLRRALDELSRRLRKTADTRARVRDLWRVVGCPWSLRRGESACEAPAEGQGPAADAWLRFSPERVGVGGLRLAGAGGDSASRALELDVGMHGVTEVVAGGWPGASVVPLPPPSKGARAGFDVAFHAELPYDVVAAATTEALAERRISLGQAGRLRIERVAVAGRQAPDGSPRLLLEVHLDGAVRGIVHAWGRPVYDAETRRLTVTDVDFTVDTRDRFVRALTDDSHERLRQELARRAVFDAAPQIAELRQALQGAMSQTLAPGLRSDGEVANLTVLEPVLSRDRVLLPVRLDGMLRVTAAL